jgi:hypothetical protein
VVDEDASEAARLSDARVRVHAARRVSVSGIFHSGTSSPPTGGAGDLQRERVPHDAVVLGGPDRAGGVLGGLREGGGELDATAQMDARGEGKQSIGNADSHIVLDRLGARQRNPQYGLAGP